MYQEPPASAQIGAPVSAPHTATPSPPQERETTVTEPEVTPAKQRPKMAARFPDPQAHSTPMVHTDGADEPAKVGNSVMSKGEIISP